MLHVLCYCYTYLCIILLCYNIVALFPPPSPSRTLFHYAQNALANQCRNVHSLWSRTTRMEYAYLLHHIKMSIFMCIFHSSLQYSIWFWFTLGIYNVRRPNGWWRTCCSSQAHTTYTTHVTYLIDSFYLATSLRFCVWKDGERANRTWRAFVIRNEWRTTAHRIIFAYLYSLMLATQWNNIV